MSRSQPKVLVEMVDKKTYKVDQVLEAAGIWAIFFDGQPINLKNMKVFRLICSYLIKYLMRLGMMKF